MSDFDLPALAENINSRAQYYRIGTLQQLRADLHGLQRRPGRNIFSSQTTTDDRGHFTMAADQNCNITSAWTAPTVRCLGTA